MKKLPFIISLLILVLLRLGSLVHFYIAQTETITDTPSSGAIVNYSGDKIFIQDYNSGGSKSIIMIHGFGSHGGTFFQLIDYFTKKNYHVVTIDFPPFGYSEKVTINGYSTQFQAERLAFVAKQLGLKKYSLLAHSIGSRIAIEHAIQYSNSLDQIILLAPAVTPGSGESKIGKRNPLSYESVRIAITKLIVTNEFLSKSLLGLMVHDKNSISDYELLQYKLPSKQKDISRGVARRLYYIASKNDHSRRQDISLRKTITTPILLIRGDQDTITPVKQGEELVSQFLSAKLEIIGNIGHIPHIENPEATITSIDSYLFPSTN